MFEQQIKMINKVKRVENVEDFSIFLPFEVTFLAFVLRRFLCSYGINRRYRQIQDESRDCLFSCLKFKTQILD